MEHWQPEAKCCDASDLNVKGINDARQSSLGLVFVNGGLASDER